MRLSRSGFATSALFSIFLSFVQSQENFEVSTVVDGSTQQEPYNNLAILPDGSVLLSDKTKHCIWKFTEGSEVTLYAGMPGSLGNRDGKGTQARFCHPTRLDTDRDGNAYVVDNGTAVRRITPSGDVVTIAGSSTVQTPKEGAGQAASFAPLSDLIHDPSTCSLLLAEPGTRRIRSVKLRQQCESSGGGGGGGGVTASWLAENRWLLVALLVGFLAGVGATLVTTRVQRGGGIASVGPTAVGDVGHFVHRTYEAGAGIVRHGADRLSRLWPTHPASQPTSDPFLAKQSTSSLLAAAPSPHSAKQPSSESAWDHPDLMDLEGPERGDEFSGLVGEPKTGSAAITWEERGVSDHKSGRGSETGIGSISSGLTSVENGRENLTSGAVPTGQFPVLEESVQFVARQNKGEVRGGGGSKG